MIVIKGWRDNKDMYVMSKACEHIAAETAVSLIESVKTGSTEGRIRLPGGRIFNFNRYPNGRIVLTQIA